MRLESRRQRILRQENRRIPSHARETQALWFPQGRVLDRVEEEFLGVFFLPHSLKATIEAFSMRVHPSPAGMKTMLPLLEAERMSHFLGKDDAFVQLAFQGPRHNESPCKVFSFLLVGPTSWKRNRFFARFRFA